MKDVVAGKLVLSAHQCFEAECVVPAAVTVLQGRLLEDLQCTPETTDGVWQEAGVRQHKRTRNSCEQQQNDDKLRTEKSLSPLLR